MTELFDKKTQKNWKAFWLQKDFFFRLLVGLICFLVLGLFLHFREVRVDMLELDSVASRYVIASVDFDFSDDEATILLREEASRVIGKIYKIDEKELRQVRFDFENELIHNQEWRQLLPTGTYEQLYKTADVLEDFLELLRFTDLRTIQKIKDLNISSKNFLVFTPPEGKGPIVLSEEYWRYIKEDVFAKEFSLRLADNSLAGASKETVQFVIQFFEKRPWMLEQDHVEEKLVKEAIHKSIPQKYSRVKAGTRIIGQGEKVTLRHVAMLQAMKKAMKENRKLGDVETIFGNFFLAFLVLFVSSLYLRLEHREVFKSFQKLSLLVSIFILTLLLAKIAEYILLQGDSSLLSAVHYPIILPFAAILLTVLFNSQIALFLSSFLLLALSATMAVEMSQFLIINFIPMLIAIISSKALRKRKEVFFICGKCLLGIFGVVLFFYSFSHQVWSGSFLEVLGACILWMLIIAILIVGILPILESVFHVMTDVTLMEYMDPNNELLRRMTLEIPGTYQHSLVLGNLAEIAARTIGANGLFCRVATLYHDLGKLQNAYFFTENQKSGVGIQQLLTPAESAQVIIGHVKEGEFLARKYHLPQEFIDVIRQHHGTTLVYYFYHKELERKKGDVQAVDESLFRYPGPKPQTKEAAIIMIADAAEAASRSLEDFSEKGLTEVIQKVIQDRMKDGQFEECPLTFEDLSKVKDVLIKTLLMIHHARIKYPEQKT